MVDSIRKVVKPKDNESYTVFMNRCTANATKGFNRDGSRVTYAEAFEKCRESWDKTKRVLYGEDDIPVWVTENGFPFLTQNELNLFEVEG